jgi:hypothetical protein
MTKDGEMARAVGKKQYPRMTSTTRTWMLVPLCAALGCGSGAAAAIGGDSGGPGSGGDSGGPGSGFDAGLVAEDTGTNPGTPREGGQSNMPEGGSGRADTGPVACLLDGWACSIKDGGTMCCNSDCINGLCGGCLGEGQLANASQSCCDGLGKTTDGYCGSDACVWEGADCGEDGGKVCCNDDCNSEGKCGPLVH